MTKKIFTRLFLLVMILVATFSNTSVFAAVEDGLPASEIKALDDYKNWVAETCGGAGGDDATLVGGENLEKIFNYFTGEKQLSKELAAGVVGNIAIESGGDPQNIQNPGGRSKDPSDAGSGGWGLIQWTPGSRVPGYKEQYDVKGEVYSLRTQLDIVWNHMTKDSPTGTNNMLEGYKKLPGSGEELAAKAAVYFEDTVEGAGVTAHPEREAAAKLAFRTYKGSAAGGGASVSEDGTCNSSVQGNGDLIATIKSYAHEDYHAAPFLDRKPAYAQAVTQAQKKGLYIGGSVGGVPGIDCGGFVTRAMLDSGYEPGYNSSGKGGATTSQQAWLDSNWQKINNPTTANLEPGDVAINSQHTYMYVGKVDGFNSVTASASYSTSGNGRAPMAGHEAAADPSFSWYRKK